MLTYGVLRRSSKSIRTEGARAEDQDVEGGYSAQAKTTGPTAGLMLGMPRAQPDGPSGVVHDCILQQMGSGEMTSFGVLRNCERRRVWLRNGDVCHSNRSPFAKPSQLLNGTFKLSCWLS